MKNFKECKKIFIAYSKNEISQVDFDNWSKEHCETCKLFIGKKDNKHCIFGKINK